MDFTAETVWACAVAADRINDGYLKEDQWQVTGQDTSVPLKKANKQMVKAWLRDTNYSHLIEDDYSKGREIRDYFKGFLFRAINGQCSDFEKEALRIAQKETFTGRDMLDFAIVSCLPSVMLRDQAKTEMNREIRYSTQLSGNEGDKVQGEIEIISCFYSQAYEKYKIKAKLLDSFVDFWYNKNMEKGQRVVIKAKIKSQRDNNTTQLNYVKVT